MSKNNYEFGAGSGKPSTLAGQINRQLGISTSRTRSSKNRNIARRIRRRGASQQA